MRSLCRVSALAVAALLIVALGLVLPVSALAAPPSLSAMSPADGSRFISGFTITFGASDPDGIAGAGATIVVGGTTYRPAVSYAGYWDGEEGDEYWVSDITQASFRLVVPDPGPGTHTVTISVPDTTGEIATRTIMVTRTAALTFSAESPVEGGAYTSVTSVSAFVNGSSISTSSALLTIDGVELPVQCDMVASGKAVARADAVLSAGVHTAVLSVGDGTDAPPALKTWTFNVTPTATPPVIGPSQPAEGSTQQGAFSLKYTVTDPDLVDGGRARLVVGSLVTAPSVTYAGYWDGDGCDEWWVEDRKTAYLTFAVPNLSPGSHVFQLEVPDAQGNWAVRTTTLLRSAAIEATAQTPADGSRNATVDRVSVTLTGSSVDEQSVTMTLDGVAVVPAVTTVGSDTVVTLTQLLTSGSHRVEVAATDTMGSPTMSTAWGFVVDATAPEVKAVSPQADSTLAAADAGISVRIEDADGVVASSVVLSLDGVAVPVSTTSGSGGVLVNWSGVLAEGAHAATVTARDVAGNAMSYPWTFTVADPPRFGAVSPIGRAGASVELRAEVSDVNAALDPTVSVTVDGAPVTAVLQPVGARSGVVVAQLSGLADGSHSASVQVKDEAGNAAVKSWFFEVDAKGPATISLAPAPSSVLRTSSVSLHAVFEDEGPMDTSRTLAWLDGAPVTVSSVHDSIWVGDDCESYEVPIPERLLVSRAFTLHDGAHTLKLSVFDVQGNKTDAQWSFEVRQPPVISDVRPAVGGRTTDTSTTVSAKVTDYDGIAQTQIAYREANTGRTPGEWTIADSSYTASSGQLTAKIVWPKNDTRYEVRFVGKDPGGLETSSVTNVFVASGAPSLNVGTDCLSCHSDKLQTHLMTDCLACHGSASGPCDCHSTGTHSASLLDRATVYDHGFSYTGRTCIDCHTHTNDVEAQRHGSGISSRCTTCHKQALTAEHYGRDDGTGTFSCSSCHRSTDPAVVAAIAANRTDCNACHTMTSGHAEFHRSPDISGTVTLFASGHEGTDGRYQVSCGLCHAVDNVSAIHSDRCETCHPAPRDTFTAWDDGCQQGSCHPTIHAQADSGHVSAGCGCHGNDWIVTPERCGECHRLVDTVAPVTSYVGPTWFTGDAVFEFLASDLPSPGGSGLAATHFTVDGGQQGTGSAATIQAPLSGTETHLLTFWSVDGDGNVEEANVRTITVSADTLAPSTTADVKSSYVGPASISLTATDNAVTAPTTYYRLDGGAVRQGGLVMVTAPTKGLQSHVLEYWSVDAEGNAEEPHQASFTVSADTQAPVTTVSAKPFYKFASNERITFSASDGDGVGVDGVYCAIDGAAAKKVSEVVLGQWFSAGVHKIVYWSVDRAGNAESKRELTFSIDGTAPTTTSDAVASYAGPATINLTAADAAGGSGVAATYYRVDGGSTQQGDKAIVQAFGSHAIEFWSVDAVGNAEQPKRVTFMIGSDTTPPTTTSDAKTSYVGSATITLSATDQGTGVRTTYYRLNGSAPVEGTVVRTDGTKSQTLEFWSVDHANNVESPRKVVNFTVSVPGGYGTIRYGWEAAEGSWSKYYLYDSAGRLMNSGSNTLGWWIVHVPPATGSYRLEVNWYDAESDTEGWSSGYARIDRAGRVVTWWY